MKAAAEANQCVIWRLLDGKPGHENQTLGLCRALESLLPVKQLDIAISSRWSHLLDWVLGRFPSGAALPRPDLIIGAGHATHLALLAARRCYGGRALVLMKPSLPVRLFDLCIVPEHDDIAGKNLFQIKGVLNTIQASPSTGGEQTLLLIGGLSAHYGWSDEETLGQILAIVDRAPQWQFTLTTSRRTPDSFLTTLEKVNRSNLVLVPWRDTEPGWVTRQLAVSGEVWVTEDSVSMVYEALTSGSAVGLLQLPEVRPGRVTRGITQLQEEGRLTSFIQWQRSGSLKPQASSFNEARRCAEWIYGRWLKSD
ncbi:MAG: mitochondrial fission ELM1 family protein [Sedimenticola sp.]